MTISVTPMTFKLKFKSKTSQRIGKKPLIFLTLILLNYKDEKNNKFNSFNEFAKVKIDKVTPMTFGYPNDKNALVTPMTKCKHT